LELSKDLARAYCASQQNGTSERNLRAAKNDTL
jgi:hypothetical protein